MRRRCKDVLRRKRWTQSKLAAERADLLVEIVRLEVQIGIYDDDGALSRFYGDGKGKDVPPAERYNLLLAAIDQRLDTQEARDGRN